MTWDRWQAPDRDSLNTFEDVNVELGMQTRVLLQMEGAKGTIDEEVAKRTGEKLERTRRPHKLLERMGVLYPDAEGNTRLTDLGRALRDIPDTSSIRRRIAESAIPILAKYQLKNPVDDEGNNYPRDTDIHPYWAIWKAASELDWKLHWDELNREIFWVLRHDQLDAAIERIRNARLQSDYDPVTGGVSPANLRERAYDQEGAPQGKTPDGQVRYQKTTPWFKKAGFGSLLLVSPGNSGGGYWTVSEEFRQLIAAAVHKIPPYYAFDSKQDWFKYFGSYEAWAKAPADINPATLEAAADAFSLALKNAKLSFGKKHENFVRTFLASLVAKRFVILSGLSGSGKTQIAQKLGQWFGAQCYDVVPVRPDWTGPEPLIGYEDALIRREDGIPVWSVPRVLEFCTKCRQDPLRPYLLLLDEMNLAHVEQYFAEFLSGMESGEPVLPDVSWDPYAKQWILLSRNRVVVPENLFIVGTVNIDETTYMFSPKVLDRAHTIEFRMLTDDLPSDAIALEKPTLISPADEVHLQSLLDTARDAEWQARHSDAGFGEMVASELRVFHSVLEQIGFEFGYRVIYDSGRFASILRAIYTTATHEDIFDRVVFQKLLPRLHGSKRRLEPALVKLSALCYSRDIDASDFDPLSEDIKREAARLPASFDKLVRMIQRIRADHFTSFAE